MNCAALAALAVLVLGRPEATPSPRPAPAVSPPSVRDEARGVTARLSLDAAVAEIDACCGGTLEKADWDGQRRWADSLYRWLVLSLGRVDLTLLRNRAAFAAQAERLDPVYVAHVAVHRRAWLEKNRTTLPQPAARVSDRRDLARFVESVYVLGVVEQDLERAAQQRDAALRRVEEEYGRVKRDVEEGRAWALASLAVARSKGQSFDFRAASASQRESIAAAIRERDKKIDALKQEFWAYTGKWKEQNKNLEMGAAAAQSSIGEYQKVANDYDERIKVIAKEIDELKRKQARFERGAGVADLDDLEQPPAVRPVPSSPGAPATP